MHATTTLSLLASTAMLACHLGSSSLGGVQAFLTPAVGPKPFTTGFTTLKPRAAAGEYLCCIITIMAHPLPLCVPTLAMPVYCCPSTAWT